MSLSGQVLAHRYRLGAALGRGGAAQAYRAEDLLDGGQVALKLLHPALPIAEFRREFERVRELGHPHLTRVHDFAVTRIAGGRRAFYTAELVEGGDLRSFVGKLGFARAQLALGDVLDALHLLHRLGLRHGDVKPENVLVDAQGRAVLIDLGCASPLGLASLTLSGTPGYLAPELTRGEPADERADFYAFGCMLRELSDRPALDTAIARLTAELPRERPSTAREILDWLGDARDVESSTRGRAPRFVGRESQLAEAGAALARVVRAEAGPRCLWVEGPAGIGRSRFVRELCFALAAHELDVLEARATEPTPVRAALLRRQGAFGGGFEALAEQLQDVALGREACLLVLDDAQRLEPDARTQLDFALRSLPARGRLAALIASSEPPPDLSSHGAGVLHVVLEPLTEAALAAWTEATLSPARVHELLRFTGGYPRYIERALLALSTGRLRESELAHASLELDGESARALSLALLGLSLSEQRALLELALLGKSETAPTSKLFERDLLTRHGARIALAREADGPALLSALDASLVRAGYASAARELVQSPEPDALARAVAYFALAGETREASELLDRVRALALRSPRVFSKHLAGCSSWLSASQRVFLARLLRLAGEARRALSELSRARKSAASVALYVEAAEVYLALGRPQRAERFLLRCLPPAESEHSELWARVLVRRGSYEQARQVASEALARADVATHERARLLETLALALAYLGELPAAREQVELAFALHAEHEVRARARCLSLRGFVALRAGQNAEAVSAYSEAFQLAEPHGLVDLVLNALSNLGNARQSLGRWGGALDTYERALRLAHALDRRASVRSLRANLANLALEIGSFERARAELDALAEPPLRRASSAAADASLMLYRAELWALTGEPERALSLLRELLATRGIPRREQTEGRVLMLAALRGPGDPAQIAEALASLTSDLHGLPVDLLARVAEVEAPVLADMGRVQLGIERLESALAQVRASDDQALLARLETALWQLCEREQASSLANEYRTRARARWERVALDLPAALRDVFWAHPRRLGLVRESVRESSASGGRASLSLSRVRELNRRIGALHQRDEVLAFALDAAIELTAAERGFVLLRETDTERGFTVAAAHNMEGARMRKSEWKWSRSIAERVIREGEPVLTVDAGSDPRFLRQASVHAMQLKSVLCAPIRGKSAIVGALYLDNRLARARFAADDAELLLTFADQVAIALAHAELVLALEHKAHELMREKRKVEQLARGQASEIERLSDELSAQKASLGTRYDYRDIVGRSEPMRRVLALLDRVTDTDLSVLVQGESGTGKELVARALHQNGPRAKKPFVGINCAALPEALLESELFGHVKGAFTGASSAREGLFVSARGGTLFLDELGELPLSMQAKLLRVLNDGEVRAVGATRSKPVDVRLVCATNKNLKQCVREGSFREDLFYRVSVVELTLPPLRERSEDIVEIAERILESRAEQTGAAVCKLGNDAVRALLSHPFPGNVRELQNTLLRASVMASGDLIRAADLSLTPSEALPVQPAKSRGEYVQKEAARLLYALEAERWNVSQVAKNLGIPRNTLYRKLARHGISRTGD